MSVINMEKQFHITVNEIIISALFHMAANMVLIFKYHCDVSLCGGYTNTVAVNYAQIACLNSLQTTYNAFHHSDVWELCIDLDFSTNQSKSYLFIHSWFMFGKKK